jgi:DNA primase
MAGSRYTRQQLSALRNHIPIDRVIEALAVPSSIYDGHYRFRCPVCNEFNTGINPKTNLARCFNCQKNYNTIDLVIKVMGVSFIESAGYLEKLKTNMPTAISRTERSKKVTSQNELIHIGDIFKSLIPPSSDKASSDQFQKHENQAISDLQKRVCDLERCIKSLTEKIKLIERK